MCILMKQYIYRIKCENTAISRDAFVNELIYLQNVEYAIAKREVKVGRYINNWSSVFFFDS